MATKSSGRQVLHHTAPGHGIWALSIASAVQWLSRRAPLPSPGHVGCRHMMREGSRPQALPWGSLSAMAFHVGHCFGLGWNSTHAFFAKMQRAVFEHGQCPKGLPASIICVRVGGQGGVQCPKR